MTVRFGGQPANRPLVALAAAAGGEQEDTTTAAGLAGRRVAAYLAKYVTKSAADFGMGASRLREGIISELDVTDHVRRNLYTIAEMAQLPERHDLAACLHTLGHRGHVTTKTRRYSTTMGALRALRETWHRQQHQPDVPGERSGPSTGDPNVEPETIDWRYAGCGHANDRERLLALTAAGSAGEMRRTAREELAAEPRTDSPGQQGGRTGSGVHHSAARSRAADG